MSHNPYVAPSNPDGTLDALHAVNWGFSLLFMLSTLVLCYGMCVYYMWKIGSSYKYNIISISLLQVIVPDIVLILNYSPVYIASLARGQLIPFEGGWCRASGFIVMASVTAANVGAVAIAITTKRAVDMKWKGNNTLFQIGAAIVGWTLGCGLSIYYEIRGILGSYRTLYCGANNNTRVDVSVPTFAVFFVCSSLTVYFYYRAYSSINTAIDTPVSGNKTTSVTAQQSKTSNPEGRKAKSHQQKSSLQAPLIRFGGSMCLIFYFSWMPVSIVAAINTAGFTDISPWVDVAAALAIKVGLVFTGITALQMMRNIYVKVVQKQNRARNAIVATNSVKYVAPVKFVAPETSDDIIKKATEHAKPNNWINSDMVLSKEAHAAETTAATTLGASRAKTDALNDSSIAAASEQEANGPVQLPNAPLLNDGEQEFRHTSHSSQTINEEAENLRLAQNDSGDATILSAD